MSTQNPFQRLAVKQTDTGTKWGVVSWHLPREPRNVTQYPVGAFRHIHEYVPQDVARKVNGVPQADAKTSSFAMLMDNEDGTFSLKVNGRGWDNKDKIMNIAMEYDEHNGPSLFSVEPVEISENELYIIEYRMHLTHGDTGLRDVITWEDVTATGTPPEAPDKNNLQDWKMSSNPKYVTSYVWCFTETTPEAMRDTEEEDDDHFAPPTPDDPE